MVVFYIWYHNVFENKVLQILNSSYSRVQAISQFSSDFKKRRNSFKLLTYQIFPEKHEQLRKYKFSKFIL